jgi:hypothetical protein
MSLPVHSRLSLARVRRRSMGSCVFAQCTIETSTSGLKISQIIGTAGSGVRGGTEYA